MKKEKGKKDRYDTQRPEKIQKRPLTCLKKEEQKKRGGGQAFLLFAHAVHILKYLVRGYNFRSKLAKLTGASPFCHLFSSLVILI